MAQEKDHLVESKKYDFDQIKNLIEDGFMHDWAISIEYAVRTHQQYSKWIKWDKTLFALKDPNLVLDKLRECCKNNPECSMKLVCEHFSPDCRLIYCIYQQNKKATE
jgi:ribulose bisphosphate carboxylase small subunit